MLHRFWAIGVVVLAASVPAAGSFAAGSKIFGNYEAACVATGKADLPECEAALAAIEEFEKMALVTWPRGMAWNQYCSVAGHGDTRCPAIKAAFDRAKAALGAARRAVKAAM